MAKITGEMIDNWIEKASDSELKLVANPNCSDCMGQGWVIDDPSPAGIGLASGFYVYICDCVNINGVRQILEGEC